MTAIHSNPHSLDLTCTDDTVKLSLSASGVDTQVIPPPHFPSLQVATSLTALAGQPQPQPQPASLAEHQAPSSIELNAQNAVLADEAIQRSVDSIITITDTNGLSSEYLQCLFDNGKTLVLAYRPELIPAHTKQRAENKPLLQTALVILVTAMTTASAILIPFSGLIYNSLLASHLLT